MSEPEAWEEYRRSVALQNALGVASRAISPDEVRALLPYTKLDGLLGATYCAEDGHCDPHGVATGYLAAARRMGVEVLRATPATGIRRAGERVTAVETPAGVIACDVVVNAAGPWAGAVGALAGIAVPVRPYRRCIYMTEAMPEVPVFPFTIDTASGFYMRKEGEKLLMGVSNESEPPGENLAVDWDWMETVLEAGARASLPGERRHRAAKLLGRAVREHARSPAGAGAASRAEELCRCVGLQRAWRDALARDGPLIAESDGRARAHY